MRQIINLKTLPILLLSLGLLNTAYVAAEAETPPSDTPACSIADVNQALDDDLTCSTEGTVFFGTDVTQFVLNQCSTISTPDQSKEALKKSQVACLSCAKRAWDAFSSAAKAGLIHPTKIARGSAGKIRKLCNITNDGEEGDGPAAEPPASDAMKSMYEQIRLCFPQPGTTVAPDQCLSCSENVLSSALSAGVLNQAKYDVLKKGVQQVCAQKGDKGGETPPPNQTPKPGEGDEVVGQFYNNVRTCVTTYHTPQNNKPELCVGCLQAVSTEGVPAEVVSKVIPYATSLCKSSFDAPK